MKGGIHLAWEEIMGYGENITSYPIFVDGDTVFALFLAVGSPRWHGSFINSKCRTGSSR